MKTLFSSSFDKKLENLYKANPKLLPKIAKQIKFFQFNPNYPSLRNHRLSGSFSKVWSISVDMNFRALYRILPDGSAYFFDIGTHDEIYRK